MCFLMKLLAITLLSILGREEIFSKKLFRLLKPLHKKKNIVFNIKNLTPQQNKHKIHKNGPESICLYEKGVI